LIWKGVRPATLPAAAKVCLETVGRVTVKSLPAGVTMSQVLYHQQLERSQSLQLKEQRSKQVFS